ncbi:hypothetical protein [Bifidobacterium myosotis]|uniref:Uncharacterized protein n=1 Tax=Bifidobacterium myosotis TaxID=1630166 RepID=A0A5M9ZKL0_9BIFI|nr:hypothetical protein [Bifidobacterium myosotis]KAA8828130.1 hypothetical protein EMO91_06730 [Bifidobacterium myosotis]
MDDIEYRIAAHPDRILDMEAVNPPAGTAASIIRRSPRLPYEARFSTPEGGRVVCFDTEDAARGWIGLMAGRYTASEPWRRRRTAALDVARILDRLEAAPRGDAALDHGRSALMLALNAFVADAGAHAIRGVGAEPLEIATADGGSYGSWEAWAAAALDGAAA